MSDSNPKEKARSLVEGISESTAACLITMVQGNLLSLTLGHLIVASQTGVIAGVSTFAITLLAKVNYQWGIHLLLGILTAIVDYLIHPGSFGGVATEAIVTGVAAGLISFLISIIIKRLKSKEATSKAL